MNKQEAIKKIEKLDGQTIKDKDFNFDNEMITKGEILEIIEQINEQEKPVVPQYVADWYEENKDDLEYNLYKLCTDFREQKLREDFNGWFNDDNNKSIETLVLMHKFGYEVEKEKLYTVEIPNPNKIGNASNVLMMNGLRQVVIVKEYGDNWKTENGFRLTESEIKEDFEWAFQFAEEVE